MSYPPPSGTPQNPPQQPGYGPPPELPPPGSPPPQTGESGYPPTDPYAAPPGDPYALATPGIPAAPQQHHMPLAAQPPPKKSKLGWILGAVAAVVVVAAATVTVVMWGGGDSQGTISAARTEEDSNEDSGSGDGDASDEGGGDAEHVLNPDLCENLDYSELEKAFDFDTPEGGPLESKVYCTSPDSENGFVAVDARQHSNSAESVSEYESLDEEGLVLNPDEIEGDWENGVTNVSEHGGSLLAQSSNLVVVVEAYPSLGDKVDSEVTRDGVAVLAESVFEATAV